MSIYGEGDPFIEWSEANDANDDGAAVLAAEREAGEVTTVNPGLIPVPGTAYEVVWLDGDIYANRHGKIRLTADEARAAARVIGGTWREAAAPSGGRLYFYALTCGHEMANLYEWEPGTGFICRGENRAAAAAHPATVVRLARARDAVPEPVPGSAPAPPDER